MKKTTINYRQTFTSHFIQGKVTAIDLSGKRVTVDNGDIILFTDLVIAVGSVGPFPGKCFDRRSDDAALRYRELGNEVSMAEGKHRGPYHNIFNLMLLYLESTFLSKSVSLSMQPF